MLVFPACYGPGHGLILRLREANEICISGMFPFEKGSIHSRMRILCASGPLLLSIPVKKHAKGALIHELETDPVQKWQHQHWRSVYSAYGKSPYFHYFRNELEHLFLHPASSLAGYTAGIFSWALRQYFPEKKIHVSLTSFPGQADSSGLPEIMENSLQDSPPYRQVFGPDFVPGLCMLDHLFCAGPKSIWTIP